MTIMRALAIFAGSLNIPANKAVNPKMESFIHLLLEIGVQIQKSFPTFSLNPSDVFKMENANNLRDYIMIAAKEIKESSISLFKEKYINLEIDSGTVSKLNVVHFVISVTEDDTIKPYLYRLVRNTNFDYTDYYIYTEEIVNQLLDYNMNVSSIIIDNLRAQTKGIEYFRQISEDPRVKGIQIVHCFCHLMSLTFTTTLKLNAHLQKLVNDVKNIITILRKADSVVFIGKKCPLIVETRWIYIYDVLEFILDNKNDVLTLLSIEKYPVEMDELEQLFKLVLPLRHFVEKMESNSSICCVARYINDMVVYY